MSRTPADVELVVISHNHGDHTGGLLPFLGKNEHAGIKMKQAFGDGFVGMGVGRVIEVADD